MIPRILVGTAHIPGGGELRLMRRGDDYMIMLGGNELMSSRLSGSEEALALLACERLRNHTHPYMLIGGLGMGFTLRTALSSLPADARVMLAELVPEVLEWAKGPIAHLTGDGLSDPRVTAHIGDVHDVIASARASFDAILLDVDNGPDGLTQSSNDRLYGQEGLRRAYTALVPGGLLAIWSAAPNPKFVDRLKAAGFSTEEIAVRATGGRKGAHHVIWIATRPSIG